MTLAQVWSDPCWHLPNDDFLFELGSQPLCWHPWWYVDGLRCFFWEGLCVGIHCPVWGHEVPTLHGTLVLISGLLPHLASTGGGELYQKVLSYSLYPVGTRLWRWGADFYWSLAHLLLAMGPPVSLSDKGAHNPPRLYSDLGEQTLLLLFTPITMGFSYWHLLELPSRLRWVRRGMDSQK